MDMVLYSLLKSKMSEPTNKVSAVNGYKIIIVDVIPSPSDREENALYFVLGEDSRDGKINIGGKRLKSIIYNNMYIDYGILNGNYFFDSYDLNRDIERVFYTSSNGEIILATNTIDEKINKFLIKGQTSVDSKGQTVGANSYVRSVSLYKQTQSDASTGAKDINVGKYFNALPNGEADTLDMVTGEYRQVASTQQINGALTWANVGLFGEYRDFKCTGYDGDKPNFLNYNGLYNKDNYLLINENNAFTFGDTTFVTGMKDNQNCIYVSNGVLRLRIHKDSVVSNSTTTYTQSLQNYLKENPFYFSVGKINPTTETILSVVNNSPIKAYDGQTYVRTNTENSFPIVEIELPTKLISESPTMMAYNIRHGEYNTIILDGSEDWQNSTLLGDYREFKCINYYDETVYMPFSEENVSILNDNTNFTICSKTDANGECIFVNNKVLYIHIDANSVTTGSGTTYAKSFKQYLADNPITLRIKKR